MPKLLIFILLSGVFNIANGAEISGLSGTPNNVASRLLNDPVIVSEMTRVANTSHGLQRSQCQQDRIRELRLARYLMNSNIFPALNFTSLNSGSSVQFVIDRTGELAPDAVPAVEDSDITEIDPKMFSMGDDAIGDEAYVTTEDQTLEGDDEDDDSLPFEMQQNRREEIYAAPTTLSFANSLSSYMMKYFYVPLTVAYFTTRPDVSSDVHCGHLAGYAFDIHPFPKGSRGGEVRHIEKIKAGKRIYSVSYLTAGLNFALIKKLVSSSRVKKVFYGDQDIWNNPEIAKIVNARIEKEGKDVVFFRSYARAKRPNRKDHNNHIHVELYMNRAVEQMTKVIAEALPKTMVRRSKKPRSKKTAVGITVKYSGA